MSKNAAITLRLPALLKQRLQSRAEAEHRSLSGQVLADLERLVEEPSSGTSGGGRFLGLFAGTTVPTDEDIAEVRRLLWGRLGRNAEPA